MQKYLPSKIFIAVVASALFIIGGGYFVFFVSRITYHVSREEKSSRQSVAQSEEATLFASKDTDGDSLKDWEEVLWHTDPENADSDGDGTKDNDEILAKRDPTKAGLPAPLSGAKAGPGDELDRQLPSDVIATPQSEGGNLSESETTLTEQLARDFGEAYLRRKFGTGNVDQAYLSKILFSGITNAVTDVGAQPPQLFFKKDQFFVSQDSSSHALHSYLNQIGSIFLQAPQTPAQSELFFALQAIQEERFDELKTVLTYRDAYQTIVADMKKVAVPITVLDAHVDMVNSFWRLGLIAEQMSTFEADPIRGVTALNTYLIEAHRSIEPLKVVVKEIKARNLNFQEDEAGAIFNKYLSAL